MSTSLRNNFSRVTLFLGVFLGSAILAQAREIANITIAFLPSTATFVTGQVSTNTVFIVTTSTGGSDVDDSTLSLELLVGGISFSGKISPSSVAITSGNAGAYRPPLTFLQSGDGNIQIRATVGSATQTSSLFTVAGLLPEEQIFTFPSPVNPRTTNVKFQYRLTSNKTVTIKVLDQFGQKVWEKEDSGLATKNTVQWDGKAANGDYVAAGVYYALLEIDGKIKSKRKFGVKK